jgi:hypothetical protein
MIFKIMFFLFSIFLFIPLSMHASHVPPTPEGALEFALDLRMLAKYGRLNPMVELEMRVEDDPRQFGYRSLTAGSYYRISRHIKAGAFYRLQMGARHDDDWIFLDPGWGWVDSRDRFEHILILDFSPRFQLKFLPGENWVFMLKNRYLYNTFNNEHTLKVRPGITYFLMRNRDPLLNFSFNYALYVPINWGDTFIYSHYPYLEVLYHVSPLVKLYLNAAYKTVTWSTSEDVIEQNDPGYSVDYRAFVIGGGINFHFDL